MKFMAALQGVDLDEQKEEEVRDVSDLNNPMVASKEGFGQNEGLGFMEM
jgi:hypothetical protein